MNPLNHKKTMADTLKYRSESNYPRQCMNHSFFIKPLSVMQAGSKQERQCFVIPAIVLMHHPHRPPPSSAPTHQHVGKDPAIPTGVVLGKKKGGGEMLPWPSRVLTLERGVSGSSEQQSASFSPQRDLHLSHPMRGFLIVCFPKYILPCYSDLLGPHGR